MENTKIVIPVGNDLFPIGSVAITAAAMQALSPVEVANALARHSKGDRGTVSMDDWALNDQALNQNGRLLSTYRNRNETVFWIITESNRIATTVLLPTDY